MLILQFDRRFCHQKEVYYLTEDLQVHLFTNPTSRWITLVFDAPLAEVTLLDGQGKFLKTQKGISGMQLSLEEFENGVFFLLFKSDKGTMVKRIIRS